jgi:2-methylcitrate dehydratase PrpD
MTHAEQLAAFVVRASYDDLSATARQQLKIRVLDALGCASVHLRENLFSWSVCRSTSSAGPDTVH